MEYLLSQPKELLLEQLKLLPLKDIENLMLVKGLGEDISALFRTNLEFKKVLFLKKAEPLTYNEIQRWTEEDDDLRRFIKTDSQMKELMKEKRGPVYSFHKPEYAELGFIEMSFIPPFSSSTVSFGWYMCYSSGKEGYYSGLVNTGSGTPDLFYFIERMKEGVCFDFLECCNWGIVKDTDKRYEPNTSFFTREEEHTGEYTFKFPNDFLIDLFEKYMKVPLCTTRYIYEDGTYKDVSVIKK